MCSKLLVKEKLEYLRQISDEGVELFSEDNIHDNICVHQWTPFDDQKHCHECYLQKSQCIQFKSDGDIRICLYSIIY